MNNDVFERIAKYFVGNRNNTERILVKQVQDSHPFTRILEVVFKNGEKEKFVIKIFDLERSFSDNAFPEIFNAIIIQHELKRIGFQTKECVLLEPNSSNPVGVPFSVSECIEGQTLNTMPKEEVSRLFPKVLDYLYNLHSKTITPSFGYFLKSNKRYNSRKKVRFGEFEAEYLLADIKRDSLKFSPQEMIDLLRAIEFLNEANLFCLCHCDVTLSNIIWDGSDIHLIDWSYSHFSEPAYDIAYAIFWLLEFGFIEQAQRELMRSFRRYRAIQFDIASRFSFYLAQKYIEFGRLKGDKYILLGKQLLKHIPLDSIKDLLLITENANANVYIQSNL